MASLLELECTLADTNAKDAKFFLGSLLNDNAQSQYRRKKSLELIAQLVFLNKARTETIVEKILDIESTESHFLLLSAIKLSFRFYNSSKEAILNWLNQFVFHNDHEIRSEAFYALGRIHFTETLYSSNSLDFVEKLHIAVRNFEKAEYEIENRIDATLFKNISEFLLIAKSLKSDEIDAIYVIVQKNVAQFAQHNISNGEISHFANLSHALFVVKQLLLADPDNWLDFIREFNEVTILLQALDATIVCNEIDVIKYNANRIQDVKHHIIDNILVTKFQTQLKKLKRIIDEEFQNTAEIKDTANYILSLEYSSTAGKKKDTTVIIDLVAKFHATFPHVPLAKIRDDVGGLNTQDFNEPVDLFIAYSKMSNSASIIQKTGFSQGDEILNNIGNQLRSSLPDYPMEKYLEFITVLRDVVNYFMNAVRGGKSRFDFLFKANALEVELQNSMLTFLQTTERAEKYMPEVKEFADGGRVDIVYNSSKLQFPIELKRTFDTITWESVTRSYIAQAQTYAYSRDQLSIFMVMDLSSKLTASPEASVRDLFNILHLPPRQNVTINHPDYVVAFVLPGNKFLPSERSSYK